MRPLHESLWLPSPPACWGRGAGGEGVEPLEAFVDRGFDQTLHASGIAQDLVSRYPEQGVSSLGQTPVTTSITLAPFFGLMMFPVNLDDQLQCYTAKVSRVRWNRIFTTKLLVPAPSIADNLPHGVRKRVTTALVANAMASGLR